MSLYTLQKGSTIDEFFSDGNVQHISRTITAQIAERFPPCDGGKIVVIPKEDICRRMKSVHIDETNQVWIMNKKVIDDLVAEFFAYATHTEKTNLWNMTHWDAQLNPLNGALGMQSFNHPKLKKQLCVDRMYTY